MMNKKITFLLVMSLLPFLLKAQFISILEDRTTYNLNIEEEAYYEDLASINSVASTHLIGFGASKYKYAHSKSELLHYSSSSSALYRSNISFTSFTETFSCSDLSYSFNKVISIISSSSTIMAST